MPTGLPETLASLDDVTDACKGFYEQEGEIFKLQKVDALKNTLTALKKEKQEMAEKGKTWEAEAKTYKNLGLSPEEVKNLAERRQQLEDFEQNKGLEIDKIKADLTRNWEGKLQAEGTEKTRFQKAAERIARENLINAALAKANVNEIGLEFLADKLKGEISFEWHGDEVVPRLLDKEGKERVTETYDVLSLDDIVANYRKTAPMMFKSDFDGKGGSGTSDTGKGGSDGPTNKAPHTWSFAEQKAYNNKHGADAYNKLLLASMQPK